MVTSSHYGVNRGINVHPEYRPVTYPVARVFMAGRHKDDAMQPMGRADGAASQPVPPRTLEPKRQIGSSLLPSLQRNPVSGLQLLAPIVEDLEAILVRE